MSQTFKMHFKIHPRSLAVAEEETGNKQQQCTQNQANTHRL